MNGSVMVFAVSGRIVQKLSSQYLRG